MAYDGFVVGPKLYESNEGLTPRVSFCEESSLERAENMSQIFDGDIMSGGDIPPHTKYANKGKEDEERKRKELMESAQIGMAKARQSEVIDHLMDGVTAMEKITKRLRANRRTMVQKVVMHSTVFETIDVAVKRDINVLLDKEVDLAVRCDSEVKQQINRRETIQGQLRRVDALVNTANGLKTAHNQLDERLETHLTKARYLAENRSIEHILLEEMFNSESTQMNLRNRAESPFLKQTTTNENITVGQIGEVYQTASDLVDMANQLNNVLEMLNSKPTNQLIQNVQSEAKRVAVLISNDIPSIGLHDYLVDQCPSNISIDSSDAYETGGELTPLVNSVYSSASSMSTASLITSTYEKLVELTDSETRKMFPSTTVINDDKFVSPYPQSPMCPTAAEYQSINTANSYTVPTAVSHSYECTTANETPITPLVTATLNTDHNLSLSTPIVTSQSNSGQESDVEPSAKDCSTAKAELADILTALSTQSTSCESANEVRELLEDIVHGNASVESLVTARSICSLENILTALAGDESPNVRTARSSATSDASGGCSWRSVLSCKAVRHKKIEGKKKGILTRCALNLLNKLPKKVT